MFSCCARVVGLAASAGHRDAHLAKRAYNHLADIQRTRPDAVAAVIRHPATGAWAKRAAELLGSPETAAAGTPAWMMSLAAAAAIRADAPLTADLPVSDGWVVLPSVGRVATSGGRLQVSAGSVEVDGTRLPHDHEADTAEWQRLRRLSAAASDGSAIAPLIDDIDPYRASDRGQPLRPPARSRGGRVAGSPPGRVGPAGPVTTRRSRRRSPPWFAC